MEFKNWLESTSQPDTFVIKVTFTGDYNEDLSLEDPEYTGYIYGVLKEIMKTLDFYKEHYLRVGRSPGVPQDDWILEAGVHLNEFNKPADTAGLSQLKHPQLDRSLRVIRELRVQMNRFYRQKIMRKGQLLCYFMEDLRMVGEPLIKQDYEYKP